MKEQLVEIEIDTLEKNGKGSGLFTDRAGTVKRAEVPFTIPGDRIETEVKQARRGVYPGRLLRLIQGSPNRVQEKCKHFGVCGGCSFQEISYDDQLAFKAHLISTYFKPILSESIEVRRIIGCADPYYYRNKMEFTFSQDKEGQRYLGLIMSGGKGKVFNLTECHLVSPWFSEAVARVRQWWSETTLRAYHPYSNKGHLRTLTIREGTTSDDHLVMLTVSGNPEYAIHKTDLEKFQALFPESNCSVFLRIHQAIAGQETQFFEMHLQGPEWVRETLDVALPGLGASKLDLCISPAAFFQPNTKQAERLYQEALTLADLKKDDIVYDLYCGTGTIGLLASRFVKFVLGIELSAESSLDARENAKRHAIANCEILTGSVSDLLEKRAAYPAPTLIVVDPPRSGLDPKSIEALTVLKAPKLLYISCNPKTQAEDLVKLLAAGYKLHVIQPVDQFPQTPHLENIAYLTYPS